MHNHWIIEFIDPESKSGYDYWYPLTAKSKEEALNKFNELHKVNGYCEYAIRNILNMTEQEYYKSNGWV